MQKRNKIPAKNPNGEKQKHEFNDLKRTVIWSIYSREVVKAKFGIVEISSPVTLQPGDFQLAAMAKLGEEATI